MSRASGEDGLRLNLRYKASITSCVSMFYIWRIGLTCYIQHLRSQKVLRKMIIWIKNVRHRLHRCRTQYKEINAGRLCEEAKEYASSNSRTDNTGYVGTHCVHQ